MSCKSLFSFWRELIDYIAKIYKINDNTKYLTNFFSLNMYMPYIALESLKIFLWYNCPPSMRYRIPERYTHQIWVFICIVCL